MAENLTDEGIDKILSIFPKGGTALATLYCGLFTSQTPSTVPARTATGGASPSGWTEASGTSYARVALTGATWGSPSTNGSGRKITYPQITFPTAGAAWGTANGYFLATNSASGAGDVVIGFCNFDDGLAVIIGAGDIQKVTPSLQLDI